MTQTLEQRAERGHGADLVLEGGGVKGIGLAGAAITLSEAGYVFPRVAGTSAGAIVGALIAAYQVKGIELSELASLLRELDFEAFLEKSWAEKHLSVIGDAQALIAHRGLYPTTYLRDWLTARLEPLGVSTFGDLKITDDPATSLPVQQRYRLVTHTCDISRNALVRLPWDLPYYLLDNPAQASMDEQLAVIDSYPVVDAVVASMSIPYFFRPFVQPTVRGACTWIDGSLLADFPITAFDRTDGKPARWPTFGIKLSSQPPDNLPDKPVGGPIRELISIARTVAGEWNTYYLADDGVTARTVFVDTLKISPIDFGLTQEQRDDLFAHGVSAATDFLAVWNAAHPPRRRWRPATA